MNPVDPNQPLNAAEEREWRRQEHAFAAEREGLVEGDARYRLIARAAAEPPEVSLPADFAASVARRARLQTFSDAWEQQSLSIGLCAGALILMLVVLARGVDWWRSLVQTLPGLGQLDSPWVVAVLIAVVLIAAVGRAPALTRAGARGGS
jgi:hypothetical protein